MHRTTGAGNVGGQFVDEVAGVSPGTTIDEDWLNTIQEELAGLVESTGEALDGGDDGQVLTAIVAIGRGFSEDLVNTDYVILDGDGFTEFEVSTGAVDRTITLPDRASNPRRKITVRKIDSGAGKVIVEAAGADEINGTPSWEITEQYGYVVLQDNGTEWAVRGQEGSAYELVDTLARTQAAAVVGTWYNLGALSLAIPAAGVYDLEYEVVQAAGSDAATNLVVLSTLSTGNNSETDRGLSSAIRGLNQAGSNIYGTSRKSKRLTIAAGTTYYLNASLSGGPAGTLNVHHQGNIGHTRITARRIA